MTEYFKFTTKDNCILLNNEIWAICEDKQDARKVVTALRDMIRGGRRLEKENTQLKQRINSRLHFYHELYDSTHDIIAKRVVEDLEDILKR